ncbi:MAG: hypothetical protein EZS28_020462, partial [Streblomastix strix]
MNHFDQTAHKVVQSKSDIDITVVDVCLVVGTLIMIIGSNIPMRLEISKIIIDREAQIRIEMIQMKERQKKKEGGDGNQTKRSDATDDTRSTTSDVSGESGASGGSNESNRSDKSGVI